MATRPRTCDRRRHRRPAWCNRELRQQRHTLPRAEPVSRRVRPRCRMGIGGGAEAAFARPLRRAIDGAGRFSMDSEIVRVRIDSESERDDWHGWRPSAEGAEPLVEGEPMVAIVHGILRRGRLVEFLRNNLHAASRAAHHPGHRGSIDISAQFPDEHTSISLWKTYGLAQDFAYKKGGHASAMTHALKEKTHRGRGLPASPATGLYRYARDRPAALPPAPGRTARGHLAGGRRTGLIKDPGARRAGERSRARQGRRRGRLRGRCRR